jgi:hypothetical protein
MIVSPDFFYEEHAPEFSNGSLLAAEVMPLLYIIEKESYNTNNSQLQKCLVNGGKDWSVIKCFLYRFTALFMKKH